MTDFLNTNYGCHEYFKDSSYKRFHRFHQDDSYLLFNYSLGGDSCCCHGCCSGAGLFGRGLLGGGLFGGDWRGLLGILGGGLAVGGLFGLGKLIFSGGLARKEKPDNEGNPDDKLKVKDNTDIYRRFKKCSKLLFKWSKTS